MAINTTEGGNNVSRTSSRVFRDSDVRSLLHFDTRREGNLEMASYTHRNSWKWYRDSNGNYTHWTTEDIEMTPQPQNTPQIILPNGTEVSCKSSRRFQFSVRQREHTVDKDWIAAVSDTTIIFTAIGDTISTALSSYDGKAFAGFLVLAIALVVKLCR